MRTFTCLCLAATTLLCWGCNSDMDPDYMTEQPRILAVRMDPPEIRWGEPVSMQLLVGGSCVDQATEEPVRWFVDPNLPDASGWPVPYSEAFEVTEEDWTLVPAGDLFDAYETAGWIDLPVPVRLTLCGKTLNAHKILRLTTEPAHGNPRITGVDVAYLSTEGRVEQSLDRPGITVTVSVHGDPRVTALALTARVDEADLTGDNKFVYRWYTSFSKTTGGKLYVYEEKEDDLDPIDFLIGPDARANENTPSVVFSLRGEEGDGLLQDGRYDIYLVVRDKALSATTAAEDRVGMDFFYLSLCLDCEG